MRHCPECGDPLSKDGQCGSCGHGRSKSGKSTAADHHCSSPGCDLDGVFSPGMNGGGPWYCREHDPHRSGPPQAPEPETLDYIHALLAALARKWNVTPTRMREPGEEG